MKYPKEKLEYQLNKQCNIKDKNKIYDIKASSELQVYLLPTAAKSELKFTNGMLKKQRQKKKI